MLDFQSQDYIVVNGSPFKELVVLEHVSDISGAFSEIFPIDFNQSFFRLQQAGYNGQKGGFADGIVVETNGAILTKSSKVFSGMLVENGRLESSISARIRYYRQKANITQPELAKAVGCSRDRIFCYENGRTSEEKMDIELLKKMADYFGVNKYYFCNEYHVFIDMTDVPEYLKKMRKDKGMTQRKFAGILRIPLASYKTYEEGRVRIPEKYWRYIKPFQ